MLAVYRRHYPKQKRRKGVVPWQCIGPGDKFALRTERCDAIWGWRKFIDDCIDKRTGERQQGVNCAFFRNEGVILSSELVRQADAIADCLWSDCRHYTYVDPKRVRSGLPGACFLAAGWKYVRIWDDERKRMRRARTKGGLLILERVRPDVSPSPEIEWMNGQLGERRCARDWQSIDWVMKAISLAMHVALQGNQSELAAELSMLHEKARQRRDRA